MSAARQQSPRQSEVKAPVFFFGRLPKLDHPMSGREPKALNERMRAIAKAEGAAPDDALSINETRVWLVLWGAEVHEWMQQHRERVLFAARAEAESPIRAILKMAERGLAALEAERGESPGRKPPKK